MDITAKKTSMYVTLPAVVQCGRSRRSTLSRKGISTLLISMYITYCLESSGWPPPTSGNRLCSHQVPICVVVLSFLSCIEYPSFSRFSPLPKPWPAPVPPQLRTSPFAPTSRLAARNQNSPRKVIAVLCRFRFRVFKIIIVDTNTQRSQSAACGPGRLCYCSC